MFTTSADRRLAASSKLELVRVDAVREDGELPPRRPAVVEESVDRGPHGAPRVEHVVDEDHGEAVDGEVDVRGVHDGGLGGCAHAEVVAVERDVDVPER